MTEQQDTTVEQKVEKVKEFLNKTKINRVKLKTSEGRMIAKLQEDRAKKERNRKKNKVAKKSRKVNRNK